MASLTSFASYRYLSFSPWPNCKALTYKVVLIIFLDSFCMFFHVNNLHSEKIMLNVEQFICRSCDILMTKGLNIIAPTALKVTKTAFIYQTSVITVVVIVKRDDFIKFRQHYPHQVLTGYASDSHYQKQPLEVFCKKAALKNFTIAQGKHLCWSLFLIKLQTIMPELD